MKPLNKIKTKWSPELAYAIGLITTDGNLSKDGRHISFVSKDIQLMRTFIKCLGLNNKIAKKRSGFNKKNFAYWVQFGDVVFYNFLVSIGLMPAKSKTLAKLLIPEKYFFDFLRGSFDGDGTFFSYWDKRWRSSFMFYLVFISASLKHLQWIQNILNRTINVKGHFNLSANTKAYQLKYAKAEAKQIIKRIYELSYCPRLERKHKKVYNALALDKKNP